MNISLIICTWNNAKRLLITLETLCSCIIPDKINWEIVVVNNNCTDETDEIVESYTGRLPIVYVHEPQQGLSRARNAGLVAATGDLVVFTDDDVRPVPGWIATYWQAFLEKPTGFYFGGPVESEFEGQKPADDVLSYAPSCVSGLSYGNEERRLPSGSDFLAANWACPKVALDTVGAFDTSKGLNSESGEMLVLGEENDLMNRLQTIEYNPWYLPNALIYHYVPIQKSTLQHIGRKLEAISFTSEAFDGNHYGSYVCWFGVPRWMLKKLVLIWAVWISKKVTGQKAHTDFLKMKILLGKVRYCHAIRNRHILP